MRLPESLETRVLLAHFAADTPAALADAIAEANASPEADLIELTPGSPTFELPGYQVGRFATIQKTGGPLTVAGNGAVLRLVNARLTRFFDVPAGASLALSDLTLQGGRMQGTGYAPTIGSPGAGGAIRSDGTLTLDRVTLQDNRAIGRDGPWLIAPITPTDGLGGAIYSTGTLRMTACTLRDNHAIGGKGANAGTKSIRNGANGLGGGIYIGGGTAVIRDCTITGNRATAGAAGLQGKPGAGRGGGIYFAAGTSAAINAFTRNNSVNNTATTSAKDIFGSFSVLA